MEESPALRIDPDEDEIFFYEIIEKGPELKGNLQKKLIQPERQILAQNCSEGNNQISEIVGLPSGFTYNENDPQTIVTLESVSNPRSSVIGLNVFAGVADLSLKDYKDNAVLGDETACQEEIPTSEIEKEKQNVTILPASQEKEKNHHVLNDNSINIHIDHNYSTPVKTVIDKSIFQTPKSVVKADKDGGFLKVLSEIALVKAEVDESTSVYSDRKEIANDSRKGNVDIVARFRNNVNDFEVQHIRKDKERTNQVRSSNISGADDTDSDEIDVIFEKLAVNTKKPINELKIDKPHDVSDLIKLDSFIDEKTGDDCVLNERETGTEEIKGDVEVKKITKLHILDDTLPLPKGQEDECSFTNNAVPNEDERQKKILRRKTMRLLEELNEIVSLENLNEDPDIGQATLSEEAAKVIQKLKTVALDDSILSPDQYFDLDNLNETFFNNEVSDILNDTLSKPLDLLTNKDIAVLLEKINGTTLEDKFHCQTAILDSEKENFYQNKMNETFINNKQNSKSNKTPSKIVSSGKFQKTPVPRKNTPSVQLKHQVKFTPNSKYLPEIKKNNQKPLIQAQSNENRFQAGIRTAEKAVKSNLDTRIAKLTSTTSKLPISKFVKTQGKTPNRILKTPKNPKFDNIESPVQAYINAKTPVLISKVKGKSEPGLSIWPKQTTSGTKMIKPEAELKILRNEPKSNLPYVKYRSAIPFKLEKAPESRLPRLAPKMQKLILGNSPVVAKHTGRIPLTTTSKSESSTDESSIVMKPNEISIIVTKAALQSNFNK